MTLSSECTRKTRREKPNRDHGWLRSSLVMSTSERWVTRESSDSTHPCSEQSECESEKKVLIRRGRTPLHPHQSPRVDTLSILQGWTNCPTPTKTLQSTFFRFSRLLPSATQQSTASCIAATQQSLSYFTIFFAPGHISYATTYLYGPVPFFTLSHSLCSLQGCVESLLSRVTHIALVLITSELHSQPWSRFDFSLRVFVVH